MNVIWLKSLKLKRFNRNTAIITRLAECGCFHKLYTVEELFATQCRVQRNFGVDCSTEDTGTKG